MSIIYLIITVSISRGLTTNIKDSFFNSGNLFVSVSKYKYGN